MNNLAPEDEYDYDDEGNYVYRKHDFLTPKEIDEIIDKTGFPDFIKFLNMNNNCNNRVTQEQIDKLLDEAEVQKAVFWDKELNISYKLKCGFTVTGRAACVDPANYDEVIGEKYAREDAANQLWKLEGYRLQWCLYLESLF